MSRTIDLSGRTALVTGASRGIGAAVALTLAEAGAQVVLTARDGAALDEVAAKVGTLGAEALATPGDIASPEFIKALFQTAFARFKQLDILVNNAGALSDGLLGMIPDAQIEAGLRVNLTASIQCTQLAARLMQRRKTGSIILMTSIMGTVGAPGQAVYAAAKAGLVGLTRAAAKELAPAGVRVNALAPGFIETAMVGGLTDAQRAERVGAIGMGRPGTPEEVADAVLFLSSDLSRYVTGQVIGVDGAMSL
jgi:3-oxoacyl-[acyl-carrier protein] reductase